MWCGDPYQRSALVGRSAGDAVQRMRRAWPKAGSELNAHLWCECADLRRTSRATQAGLMRTIGRCGLRRATSLKPALSNMDFAPNHMSSSFERAGLSTG